MSSENLAAIETVTPTDSADRFPSQIKYIVGNEACERFSYYGVVSILTLYLVKALDMSEVHAKEVVHLFGTAVYFMPVIGGWLADRWLGRYWTILIISTFYCLGHATLALFGASAGGVFTGLALIAIGAGGIKPCVSAFVGDQFRPNQHHLLMKAYGLFYWCINLGAFFGFAVIPFLRDNHGYRWAFGVPGIFMGLATLVFWMGSRHYVRQPPARESKAGGFFGVLCFALMHARERKPGQPFMDMALIRYTRENVQAVKAVGGILMVFATVPVFWSLFYQSNTTWVLQGTKMTPFDLLGYKVDAERIQSIGPLLVLIWVPVLTFLVYPMFERLGLMPKPLRRMSAGMVLGAASFFICGWIQSRMEAGQTLSIAWQIIPYVVLEAAEVMVSATALEFAFSQAPASMKSIIMSFWLMTMAGGNFLVAVVTNVNSNFVHARGAAEFYFYAIMMALVAAIFIFCATRYRRLEPSSD